MEEESTKRKSKKMRKIEKRIEELTEKNNIEPKQSISKKIMKLEKKKAKLEKWLKVKLPFRILIRTGVTWLVIGGVCYGCSYVPIVKEVKTAAMAAIAYVAPEPMAKVLDVVTLNVGVSNSDFEWLKTTLKSYVNGEIELEVDNTTYLSYGINEGTYYIGNKVVSKEEYDKYVGQEEQKWKGQREEAEQLATDVFGTTSVDELNKMSISDILMKVATNATPEIVSQVLDMTNLTTESKQRLEQDVNRALKIIPKLNNNQMDELIDIINEVLSEMNNSANEVIDQANSQMNQMEIQAFNNQFRVYEGVQRGATIKALIQVVKVSNSTSEHQVKINENINIDASTRYTVTLQYDSNGRVNGIIIQ